MSVEYNFELKKEENLAIRILDLTNKYNTDKLHYEITNSISKNVCFTYVLKPTTDIKLIEHHLHKFNIDAEFIDKSNEGKRYLTVSRY
jgi:hypothetical protein